MISFEARVDRTVLPASGKIMVRCRATNVASVPVFLVSLQRLSVQHRHIELTFGETEPDGVLTYYRYLVPKLVQLNPGEHRIRRGTIRLPITRLLVQSAGRRTIKDVDLRGTVKLLVRAGYGLTRFAPEDGYGLSRFLNWQHLAAADPVVLTIR